MKKLALLSLAVVISACGHTLRDPKNTSKLVDLSHYNQVIVNDFTNAVNHSHDATRVTLEGKNFADMVANDINARKLFIKVERNVQSINNAVLIDGQITDFKEFNHVKGDLVGYRGGNSRFDAVVYVKDNTTKEIIGSMKVDHVNLALGNANGGPVDAKSLMFLAAKKIVNEVEGAIKGTNTVFIRR